MCMHSFEPGFESSRSCSIIAVRPVVIALPSQNQDFSAMLYRFAIHTTSKSYYFGGRVQRFLCLRLRQISLCAYPVNTITWFTTNSVAGYSSQLPFLVIRYFLFDKSRQPQRYSGQKFARYAVELSPSAMNPSACQARLNDVRRVGNYI